MRIARSLLPVVLTLLATLLPWSAAAAEKAVIIGFHGWPGPVEQALLHGAGGTIRHQFKAIPATAARLPEEAMDRIKTHPRVAFVEEDAVTALVDPSGTGSEEPPSWGIARVGALEMHAQGNYGQGVKIACLDTGIDFGHPELAASYRGGINVVNPASPEPLDDSSNGHGTHVAGIMSAANDGIGVVGIAPAADLYAVKVSDGSGFGTISDLIAGLEWAMANQVDIVNISLGTSAPSLALEAACRAADEAGMLLVAAAGNTRNSGGAVLYPAAYDQVVAVSATASDNSAVYISAVGPQIELAAPGGNIYSTVPGGGYAFLTGTSQAAPHVAGVAALQLAAGLRDLDGNGSADNRDLRRQLQQTALDLGEPGVDATFGYGLVRAVPVAPAIALRLVHLPGRLEQSIQSFMLPTGYYEIGIRNDGLARIQIVASDRSGDRADLSRSVSFRGKAPEEVIVPFIVTTGEVEIRLVPEGAARGFADIIIRMQ